MIERLKENQDVLIVAIASFFIGFGAASLFTGDVDKDATLNSQKMETKDTTLPPLPFNTETAGKGNQMVPVDANTFVIENQRAGVSVFVKKAEFSEPRWIVIREANAGDVAGAILGAGWFPAGAHENIIVPLLRGTVGGEQYQAELFFDSNGDKQFDHNTDQPLKDTAGNAISISFNTVASAGGE
ncbi:MAG: hypothetical protein A3J54_01820 [Candidatus Ryanbacteria bacterium RIFCSPHIGHO2_02_FULL_45_13b]|uniref:DUF7282 domain-containing protein n=1 Tax=Candidatus Ryanbacteria bacterium RIFCSPHIGHO2_02_FULL_45_13b TaxID=1802117 RepID=A0A1G2GAK7_9BACT|nr:MAG: hypothetical protein A3J54_01820 [Candidatus Ryanbacteria bacterium RIFCSPHIGHO2_02_FULL_45_13b]